MKLGGSGWGDFGWGGRGREGGEGTGPNFQGRMKRVASSCGKQ